MPEICIALEGKCTAQLSSSSEVEENAKHLGIANGAFLGWMPSRGLRREGERWRKPTCHSGGGGERREGREVRTCEEGCGSGTVTEREMGTLAPLKQPPTGWPFSRHGPGPGHNAIFLGERVPIHFALCSTLSSCPHLQLARWPTALFGRMVGEFLPLPFQ